jgi:hypothetical protein
MTSLPRVSPGRALAALLLAVMVACSWLHPLDAAATRQIDAGLTRAFASFAAARALNAVISVAQGTAISLQPMGVGVNLTIGQVLDPVNEVVEQFSTLMLVASVAFGVEKVLVAVGAHWLVSLVLTAVAIAWAVLTFRQQRVRPWLTQALLVLLLVRFAIPVSVIGSDLVFREFLDIDYRASQQVLDRTASQLESANPVGAAATENQGLFDKLRNWAGAQGTALKEQFVGLKTAVEQATQHVIKLMVIFLLQTLVLPIALLWLLVVAVRRLGAAG